MGRFSAYRSTCHGFMFIMQRIAFIFLLFLSGFLSNSAFAESVPATFQHWQVDNVNQRDTTAEGACDKYALQNGYLASEFTAQSTTYPYKCLKNGSVWTNLYYVATCPVGSTVVDGGRTNQTCLYSTTCTPPQVRNLTTGTCEDPPPPQCTPPLVLDTATNTCKDPCIDKKGQETPYSKTNANANDSCVNGCLVSMVDGNCGTNTAGEMRCFYTGVFTGAACSGTSENSSPEPPPNPEYDCIKQGMTYGTVNGAVVCVPAGTKNSPPLTNIQSATKTTTTDSSGNTTTTTSDAKITTIGQNNGTPTITEEKIATDGTKTVTEATKSNYCELNPNAAVCKPEEVCKTSPDSPACKHACEKFPDSIACQEKTSFFNQLKTALFGTMEEDLKALGDGNGNGSGNGIIPTKSLELNFAKVQLPEANSCPPPVSVSFAGRSVTLSYDWLCSYAESFRPVVVAFAYLAAIMIIFGALKNKEN